MSALDAGVTGMLANQARMDTVGNNIANANTVGYKSALATFMDALYQVIEPASAPSATQGSVSASNSSSIGFAAERPSRGATWTARSRTPASGSRHACVHIPRLTLLGASATSRASATARTLGSRSWAASSASAGQSDAVAAAAAREIASIGHDRTEGGCLQRAAPPADALLDDWPHAQPSRG